MTPRDNCSRAIHPGAPLAGNCPHCARAHALQLAEDRLIAGRSVTQARRESARVTGQEHGKQWPQRPGVCHRGHVKTARNCQECRRIDSGADIRKPVACSVCGVEFVRRFNGQKRCASHMRTQQRRRKT